MSADHKRKAESDAVDGERKTKSKKQWRVPQKNGRAYAVASAIQYGDAGIFATCPRTKEGKCVAELRDLYNHYAELLYGTAETEDDDKTIGNIEGDILAELADLKKPKKKELFTHVKLEIQCVIFFRTTAPVDPVSLVEKICTDLADGSRRLTTRFIQRLTPVTLIDHASYDGLAKVATRVLAPIFHGEIQKPLKYAIRPNMRNHNASPRDVVIKQVATAVGPPHTVDLHNYDHLILVEYYQHICGMSVVSNAYERLKRFNLVELAQADPDPLPSNGKDNGAV